MEYVLGLLCALVAAVAFGVQYVPVKKYEIFDGVTFQWFMCAGILMVGFLSSLAFGSFGMANKECMLIVLGGALWALSNCLVLPLVKLLGIGLGFSLYHFVNLVVGYVVGRFGIFGMEPLQGNVQVCDGGCALVLVSFLLLVFVEDSGSSTELPADDMQLPPALLQIDEGYREMYHRWRVGEAREAGGESRSLVEAASDALISYSTSEPSGHLHSVGGFSVLSAPRESRSCREHSRSDPAFPTASADGATSDSHHKPLKATDAGLVRSASDPLSNGTELHTGNSAGSRASAQTTAASSSVPVRAQAPAGRLGRKLMGVLLALISGGLAGVQSVPATLYNQRHKGGNATDVVFPQCLGIYVCSSAIYLLYAAIAKLSGWRVPHSAIRPAYVSGCLWAAGFAFMVSGISVLGFSVGYTLDAVGPIVVASFLSVFMFKEITDRKQLMLYGLAFGLQLVGVVIMSAFGKQNSS
eukprot:TRINITY_DN16617_c0_g1_i3.p1 TRINITY_DN16617_c0_g1~~TRINITY_DN16617_c0_g1_i3.p1  ORF type:complete len:469 (+),score=68.18 TRINITY_DN16617_c0_g1_i3:55-1461(+)